MRILLDTNAYSRMRLGDPAVADLIRGSEEVLFSSVVAGELLAGFRGGSRLSQNLQELASFLREPAVTLLPTTWTTSDRYGRIFAVLRRNGTPIPSNDIWIAAHALETGADLVSFDRHFALIDSLAWIDPGSEVGR